MNPKQETRTSSKKHHGEKPMKDMSSSSRRSTSSRNERRSKNRHERLKTNQMHPQDLILLLEVQAYTDPDGAMDWLKQIKQASSIQVQQHQEVSQGSSHHRARSSKAA
ncbi:expressed unknown protein [Seminavis robusta]|uniref:Uncharacterized protein n=1 Tax=Seminavis robusta TaxID=568900 RepID=A0A9N8I016_9STRA|nr:expressed unknown protein [Seminavis robusta]|eukprot:Sro2468_g328580.1 n/a (108) ;mRNA; f:9541-9864